MESLLKLNCSSSIGTQRQLYRVSGFSPQMLRGVTKTNYGLKGISRYKKGLSRSKVLHQKRDGEQSLGISHWNSVSLNGDPLCEMFGRFVPRISPRVLLSRRLGQDNAGSVTASVRPPSPTFDSSSPGSHLPVHTTLLTPTAQAWKSSCVEDWNVSKLSPGSSE